MNRSAAVAADVKVLFWTVTCTMPMPDGTEAVQEVAEAQVVFREAVLPKKMFRRPPVLRFVPVMVTDCVVPVPAAGPKFGEIAVTEGAPAGRV